MSHVKWIIKSNYCNSLWEYEFLSTFYQLVEFDHGQKPYNRKAHSRLSEKIHWVCSYSTIKVLYPFNIAFTKTYFFKMSFTGWFGFWPRSRPIWWKGNDWFSITPYQVYQYLATRGRYRGFYMYFMTILSIPDYPLSWTSNLRELFTYPHQNYFCIVFYRL